LILFRRQNPAGLVIPWVRRAAQPELLTQAWCKMTECLSRYQLIEDFKSEKGNLDFPDTNRFLKLVLKRA
jgi:hypothetical protein